LGLAIAGYLLINCPVFAVPPTKAVTQYASTTWTQAEGLPIDMVRSIAQTSDGFLWIGTDEGLARFDGHEFTVFGIANGALPNDFVTTLAAARDGSLWIGTSDGLVHYSGGKFKVWGVKEGLPKSNIAALHVDKDSAIWIAAGGTLSTIRNGSVQFIPPDQLAPLTSPHAFFEDREGTLWIAGAGLVRHDGNRFVPVLGPEQMRGLIANAMVRDRNGTLWIAGNKGILALTTDGRLHSYDTTDRIPNMLVRTLWIDRDGVLWAGTNGGLIRYERDHFVLQEVEPFLHRLSIRSLFEDREGNLWMGSGFGLSRFRDYRFTSFGKPEGWPADAPRAILADRNGDLWVGYHDSGLLQVSITPTSAKPKKLFTMQDGLISNEVFSVREARNGDLLIATRAGLSRMHNGRFQNISIPDPFQPSNVFDVLEDSQDRVLLGTSRDVLVKKGAGWRTLVSVGPVSAIEQGANGDVWVGTNGAGLWKIGSDGYVQQFTKAEGLGWNRIRSLLWDEQGILWIGTFGGGLIRFDGTRFISFKIGDGLPSDNVAHIASDGAGYLWLSTTRGVARVAKTDLAASAQNRLKALPVIVYGTDDGLRSLQTGPNIPVPAGGTRTADGRLWFIAGLSVAETDPNFTEQEKPFLVASLVEASAGGKVLDSGRDAHIDPGVGPIQLHFTGLHLRAPQSVRYEYQLEGLDSAWSPPTNLRSVVYNRLAHGTYRFRLRALLGGERSPETSFTFVVLPRFYETAWFVWLCIAGGTALSYGVYQWRKRQIRARFAYIIAERTRLAREVHDTVAQGLFGISSQLDALSLKLNDPEALARDLNLARRMARHSLAEARRSVMDLRTVARQDRDLSEALASSARKWTEGSPIEVTLNLDKTNALRPDVEQNVLRIAQEAVANAMKHARPSSIGIKLGVESKHLTLRVSDDGCGFDPRPLSDTEGHFGLIGMQERARRIGAIFQVSSRPGEGTTVEVTVPV